MYTVSARKYRPDSFESLIGQDTIVKTLKNSVIRGQLAHAYLFCGPRGVGKTSAARIFAKTINCAHPGEDMEPCGECESCRSFQEGRSYCIHELDAASNNSVEDIKALIEQVNIPPQVGRYSVFIVDEVHMLSNQAFNAFLKTLEEPPAHAIFILATTEKHKILPTILSRCQTYDFNRISIADMVTNLRSIADREGITIGDESLHVIASKADGAMRDALTIFDQTVAFCGTEVKYEEVLHNLNVLSHEHCFALVDDFLRGDHAAALLRFSDILARGFNALHFVSALSSHLRNLAVARTDGLDALLEAPDSLKAQYREQAGRCTMKFIYDALAVTTSCEAGYRSSINPRLHVEFALMRLAYLGGNGNLAGEAAVPSGTQKVAGQAVAGEAGRIGQASSGEVGRIGQSAAGQASSGEVGRDGKAAVGQTVESQSLNRVSEATPARMGQTAEEQGVAGRSGQEALGRPSAERGNGGVHPAGTSSTGAAGAVDRAARRRTAPKILLRPDSKLQNSVAEAGTEGISKDSLPGDEQVTEAWAKLAALYTDRVRLHQTLVSAALEMEEKDGVKLITFRVTNDAQKHWIETKLLRELELKLCELLSSRNIKVLVEVKPQEEIVNKPYLPSEQASELMAKNPEVNNLVKDFGLDI